MNSPGPAQAGRPRVAVCVCTYRRPVVLRALLHQLADEADRATMSEPLRSVTVCVVDDDPAASAGPVVAEFVGSGLTVRYSLSGLGNVAAARNRAVDEALAHGDLLVMIDDDCRPRSGWLTELVAVQRRTGADAVVGACDTAFPSKAPRWLREQPFADRPLDEPNEAPTASGYVKNCLFTAAFINRHELRFDLAYGYGGGEDAVFLDAARRLGVDMVYAANAVVDEELPPERATLRYQLRRRAWYGNTEVLTLLAARPYSRLRLLAGSAKIALLGLVRPALNVLRRQRPHVLFNLSEVLRAAGRVLGVFGVRIEHY